MITILHTYYPPEESIKSLDLSNTIWTHSNRWESRWNDNYPCQRRYTISNIGKDIGGKLFAFKVILENRAKEKYVLFLHDKKSPQVINGKNWKSELWSICENEQINKAINLLENEDSIGIVSPKSAIVDPKIAGEEYAFATNKNILFSEAQKYEITPNDHTFVAGVTFIARLNPYLEFFNRFDPLAIRAKMEMGNVLDLQKGTYTHSWERLLSWILTSKGYRIEGI